MKLTPLKAKNMLTIDLGESPVQETSLKRRHKKWYPTVRFSDDGVGGASSFDDDDIGKTIKVNATIKLVSISSSSDKPQGKIFDYSFEVHTIEMPKDLSKLGKKDV